jgi:hypothetical protein
MYYQVLGRPGLCYVIRISVIYYHECPHNLVSNGNGECYHPTVGPVCQRLHETTCLEFVGSSPLLTFLADIKMFQLTTFPLIGVSAVYLLDI